ncbi:hypothetical protein PoB_000379600 [Plakobranchus ocellatus]|uniref:Uncharacterized protein n=1 Tax=Plakobranchus ocellatus TaxID=259542 RepID=A0AAV3Y4G9_9GAST|nr:hypothetical protein PoB_000379600 [Plakobranchus ocellatus]
MELHQITSTQIISQLLEKVRPVFKALVETELLKKCLESYTQNANECLNDTIWKLCPKHKYHGFTTVKTAVAIAVAVFNDGTKSYIAIMEEMGLKSTRYFTK